VDDGSANNEIPGVDDNNRTADDEIPGVDDNEIPGMDTEIYENENTETNNETENGITSEPAIEDNDEINEADDEENENNDNTRTYQASNHGLRMNLRRKPRREYDVFRRRHNILVQDSTENMVGDDIILINLCEGEERPYDEVMFSDNEARCAYLNHTLG
jgi:hypothetical protein